MINPSANGWIDKYFLEQRNHFKINSDLNLFYENTRQTGFIFGHIISFDIDFETNMSEWSKSEISKLTLLNTLFKTFCLYNSNLETEDFLLKTNDFYKKINYSNSNFLQIILPKNSQSKNLEDVINNKIQTNENIISKNFSHLITNALLFVDVLAYNQFLIKGSVPENYLKQIEETIINIISLALKNKSDKSEHDDLLIKLIEASVRYTKFSEVSNLCLNQLNLCYFDSELEKKYFIDLAGLSLWNNKEIENHEAYFLYNLAETLGIDESFVTDSIKKTNNFLTTYHDEIPFLNRTSPIKSFYDNKTETVVKLILRNKKRLTKEISQSKELMFLLAKSTHKSLDDTEKKKVKTQLIDICKSVPSLTIFLIPGGSLLLPILIKFIPQLLPSSFNENLEKD